MGRPPRPARGRGRPGRRRTQPRVRRRRGWDSRRPKDSLTCDGVRLRRARLGKGVAQVVSRRSRRRGR
ncbi:hypothetical protein SBRY_30893 [Actinacidiphila bryophytorum]|uniref:Uncharacterized protein n=1 Tax=Actinacidiphila bryophytorum TaxID=1436133 RepID=A0A9W4H1T5_9ACTN|nr:hypothetical protein SBRY_30893 [Actinacidiphila bryophytorum]